MIRNILLLSVLLYVLPGNAAPPFFSVPQYHESVKIDGQANEEAWEKSFVTTNFLNTDNAALEPEQTQVRMFHDGKKLYIYCRMEAFVLDPASNQRNLFRATQQERDSDVWSDDSIELRLRNQENGTPYYICINALGTILDLSLIHI